MDQLTKQRIKELYLANGNDLHKAIYEYYNLYVLND